MNKYLIGSLFIIILTIGAGFYALSEKYPFVLGLDLAGGTELTYQADVSSLHTDQAPDEAMAALRDVIERRVNVFGVSEPIVQVEKTGDAHRLIVELPGVTDVESAVNSIGETPVLEFRLLSSADLGASAVVDGRLEINQDDLFVPSGLSGKQLESASVQFGQGHSAQTGAFVAITFDDEGAELLSEITRENLGEIMAIYLDGVAISTPTIQAEITNGEAVITGNFTPEEARELARDLNLGALPVPIELINTQLVGPSLGADVTNAGVKAGVVGLIFIALFMLVWYRLPGAVAIVALMLYVFVMLALFKLIPVTLTAAGIAGFILSVGMAVDANVLVFERMKEEMNKGKELSAVIKEGFDRAWASIRDANISSLLTAIILFWFGTSLVKGFALVFGIGVILSMLTAIFVTRTLLFTVASGDVGEGRRKLFYSGFKNKAN